MRRAIGALCTLIVGLQILVGVPLAVCLVFFALAGGGVGPVAVEMHTGHGNSLPTADGSPPPIVAAGIVAAPPPNFIPHAPPAPLGNPILESRAQQGSPLMGTVLAESVDADTEQQLFVAAFEKVVADSALAPTPMADSQQSERVVDQPSDEAEAATAETVATPETENVREKAAQFAIRHLYAMANMDERAGEFDRADQWRSLARELRTEASSDLPVPLSSPR